MTWSFGSGGKGLSHLSRPLHFIAVQVDRRRRHGRMPQVVPNAGQLDAPG